MSRPDSRAQGPAPGTHTVRPMTAQDSFLWSPTGSWEPGFGFIFLLFPKRKKKKLKRPKVMFVKKNNPSWFPDTKGTESRFQYRAVACKLSQWRGPQHPSLLGPSQWQGSPPWPLYHLLTGGAPGWGRRWRPPSPRPQRVPSLFLTAVN